MRVTRIVFIPVLFSMLCLAGCGTDVPVETLVPVAGTLEVDGKPMEGVRISFIPQTGKKGRGGYALTDADGAFTVMHDLQAQPGLAAGEYLVSYSKLTLPDGSPLPEIQDGKAPISGIVPKETFPKHLSHPDPKAPTSVIPIPSDGNTSLELKASTKGINLPPGMAPRP